MRFFDELAPEVYPIVWIRTPNQHESADSVVISRLFPADQYRGFFYELARRNGPTALQGLRHKVRGTPVMTGILAWVLSLVLFPPEEREMSEQLASGFPGNYYGPEATEARREGKMPPIVMTPHMARWDRWGRQVLRDGDIVFRRGDARLLHGYFPMSRFLANCSNSPFSHTGVVAIEEDGPVVYDTTRTGAARQPFCVWILDNVGWIGVKRLRPQFRDAIPKVMSYCHRVFQEQVPFDYEPLSMTGPFLHRDDAEGLHGRRDRAVEAHPGGGHGACPRVPCLHVRAALRLTIHPRKALDVRYPSLLPWKRTPRDLVGQATHDRGPPHLRTGLSRLDERE